MTWQHIIWKCLAPRKRTHFSMNSFHCDIACIIWENHLKCVNLYSVVQSFSINALFLTIWKLELSIHFVFLFVLQICLWTLGHALTSVMSIIEYYNVTGQKTHKLTHITEQELKLNVSLIVAKMENGHINLGENIKKYSTYKYIIFTQHVWFEIH